MSFLLSRTATGQSISFHHLNTSHGLSTNSVTAVTTDHNGFLWIGTSDGLNLYDGRTLTLFHKRNNPGLWTDNFEGLLCDSRNRIWVGSVEGVTMIDEQRKFHRIVLSDTIQTYAANTQIETRSYGVIILSDKGHFYFNEKNKKWELLKFSTDIILKEWYTDGIPFSPDTLLVCASNRYVFMVDYSRGKEIFRLNIPNVSTACKLTDSTIFCATYKGRMMIVNINTKQIEKEFSTSKIVNGVLTSTNIHKVRRADDGNIIITSGVGGIYIFDPRTSQFRHYLHEPYNPLSLSTNSTNTIHCEENGNVFITTYNAGITFFNVKSYSAYYFPGFKDASGQVFDSYINQIAKDKKNNYWIAASDRLIKWNPQSEFAEFYFYTYPIEDLGNRTLAIHSVCVDKKDNVWIGTNGGGLGLLNQATKKFTTFDQGVPGKSRLRSTFIWQLLADEQGYVWAASRSGVFRLDPRTKQIDSLSNHPALKELIGKYVATIYIDDDKNFWFGTLGYGAYCWNPGSNSIKNFTTKNQLLSNSCHAILQGRNGSIYIGSSLGLSVLQKDGSVQNYTRTNGLRFNRCKGLLEDDTGNIWISNDACLMAFDPTTKSFRYFDEKVGLSVAGFRTNSTFKDSSGSLFWGSEKGLNWFDPAQLVKLNSNPNPIVFKLSVGDSTQFLTSEQSLQIPYHRNSVTFHFAAVNVFGGRNIFYQYILDGADEKWTRVTDQNEVRYNSISPGNYTFRLKASADGINWVDGKYAVNITIIPPWWRSWWFISAAVLLFSVLTLYVIRYREKVIKRRQVEKIELQKSKIESYRHQLEIEQVINYFATSMAAKYTVDEILWDVAENCIAQLGFEDCVIYLKDEKKNVLVQKAACGPKKADSKSIMSPIEIPVGRGIVGNVALTGVPEIIPDTSSDIRYIVDDARRFSELTVPMIVNDQVIGVIDSENSQKNFYSTHHLQIMTTIASLCADKLIVANAEDAREKAQMETLVNRQKATEARLQSLRLQMNPHFLFNALNSIQQMILAGDETVATRCLSKFSRLLRLVLIHSDKERVTLRQELETLQLYVELESLRFKEKFDYYITCDEAIDQDETLIPTLLIQPFVENAIWHGLMHKEGPRTLHIHFSEDNNDTLVCTIEDNGVGRQAALQNKESSTHENKHTNKGIGVATERLKVFSEQHHLKGSLDIVDLKDERGIPSGTKVIVTIPALN